MRISESEDDDLAGFHIPGMPEAFPYGPISFGCAAAFAIIMLLGLAGVGNTPPLGALLSIASPVLLIGWLIFGTISLFQAKVGWCLFGAVMVILPFMLMAGWLLTVIASMSM